MTESPTYIILEEIRNFIIEKGIEVPDDKIYIARPNQSFVGEGPIICIYPETPNREKWKGDNSWWKASRCEENISVDVLVDDIYNNARNSQALKMQLDIKHRLEILLYNPETTNDSGLPYKLVQAGLNLSGYRPNNGEDYRIETENAVMVGVVVPLTVRRDEELTRVPTEFKTVRHDVGFDYDKDGTPDRELIIDETL